MEKLLAFLESMVSEQRRNLLSGILKLRTKHFIVVAEDIYQEHNASALIRTCDCFGIQEMHVLQKSYEFKVESGMARGADKWVDLKIHKKDDGIDYFRNLGYQIVATTPHRSDCELRDLDISKKSAIYFGREREGLSDPIIEKADIRLKIPMVGLTESFNISVSTAIVLYELTHKLRETTTLSWHLTEDEIFRKKIDWYIKSLPQGKNTLQAYLKNNPDIDIDELKTITNVL